MNLCQGASRDSIGITLWCTPSVYALDMVLTNYPGIDEGQNMIFVKT